MQSSKACPEPVEGFKVQSYLCHCEGFIPEAINVIARRSKATTRQSLNLLWIASHTLAMTALCIALSTLNLDVLAISPTSTPRLSPTPTSKLTSSSPASPSATIAPSGTEDEKVKEIRDAIKEKVNAIKDKIEKRAYVGEIIQITDSTITLNNFRGKQRVRITEETKIISANKKEIKTNELAVDDKVIALGTLSDNEILEAKRVIVVPKPKTVTLKRLTLFGTITEIDTKKSLISVTAFKNLDQSLELKIDKSTNLVLQSDLKANLTIKDLKESQKIVAVYPQTEEGKTPVTKSLFLLP